ncbi:MAG: hypothetical protein K1X47_11200 [Cyclobacteriaceae bacterium]|nr:hypothetical protein [Cyclobacteriaceae bacterium]
MKYILVAGLLLVSGWGYAQKQGIEGRITLVSGNQMPGPGKVNAPPQGVRREIRVYEVANQGQVTGNGRFYSEVRTRLVASGRSKKNGKYKIKLKPGFYSVFVLEDNQLYANRTDGDGMIQPVTVLKQKFTSLAIQIDHQASY